jgi:hypothetical protein
MLRAPAGRLRLLWQGRFGAATAFRGGKAACGRAGARWQVCRRASAPANLRWPGERPTRLNSLRVRLHAGKHSARTASASQSTYARLDTRQGALVAALAARPAIAGALPSCAPQPARTRLCWTQLLTGGRAMPAPRDSGRSGRTGSEMCGGLRRPRRCAVRARMKGWRLEGWSRRRSAATRAPWRVSSRAYVSGSQNLFESGVHSRANELQTSCFAGGAGTSLPGLPARLRAGRRPSGPAPHTAWGDVGAADTPKHTTRERHGRIDATKTKRPAGRLPKHATHPAPGLKPAMDLARTVLRASWSPACSTVPRHTRSARGSAPS